MLRIYVRDDTQRTSFIIEGKLSGACVCELEKCWREAAAERPGKQILVNLTSVTAADTNARELLTRMHLKGAEMSGSGLLVDSILEEIRDREHLGERYCG